MYNIRNVNKERKKVTFWSRYVLISTGLLFSSVISSVTSRMSQINSAEYSLNFATSSRVFSALLRTRMLSDNLETKLSKEMTRKTSMNVDNDLQTQNVNNSLRHTVAMLNMLSLALRNIRTGYCE